MNYPHVSANLSPYLPVNSREQLQKYLYHGSDNSKVYKYIWKPLCASAVRYLPYWLAPNTITIAALLLVIVSHIQIAYYMPNLDFQNNNNNNNINDLVIGDRSQIISSSFETESLLEQPPSHIFIFSAVSLLLYQFLDNLDGHQARRLNMSSPLGLLMDHGCDAFNCIIGSLSFAAAVNAGPTWKSWSFLMCTVISFFLATWEEYYRGELVLPLINGPNEGILMAVILYCITAINGIMWWTKNTIVVNFPVVLVEMIDYTICTPISDFFSVISPPPVGPNGGAFSLTAHLWSHRPNPQQERPYDSLKSSNIAVDVQYNTIIVLAFIVCTTVSAICNILEVRRCVSGNDPKKKHGRYGDGWLVTNHPFLHALTRLAPLAGVTILANIWFLVSPGGIFTKHPRLFCWTVGMLYTKLAIHLMVAHLCAVEYHPFRRAIMPFLYLAGHILFTCVTAWIRRGVGSDGGPAASNVQQQSPTTTTNSPLSNSTMSMLEEDLVLFEFFIISSVALVHLMLNVMKETAVVLSMPVFTVPLEKQLLAAKEEGKE